MHEAIIEKSFFLLPNNFNWVWFDFDGKSSSLEIQFKFLNIKLSLKKYFLRFNWFWLAAFQLNIKTIMDQIIHSLNESINENGNEE